ncbi:sulfite exporter TauE/SafE family protein [uncultured Parabacteroides sp.]|uniref:sulfite exporter TauE/SafE family protein n=1 Tax=uncultured Parabacteroides sp. TaxID=512312 RepID=UPI0025FDF78E|nr:sulfite exporter TauE/SafE family protein [uncultured Parabacteroides sp.]
MDFSIWMQSPSDWSILFISALLIGISKTGIQGISMLAVPLMAINFGAKPSTGLVLPILCMADLVAVLYYRRIAEWKYVLKLLPSALAGFAVALLVDRLIPPEGFKRLMGACLFAVLIIMFWSEWKGKDNKLSACWWYGPAFGLLGGFTTMIGNAAGPVMAIYLLSVKMPKINFIGTNAWFFLVINYLKIPVQVLAWDNITVTTLMLDLCTLPFVIIGGVLGIALVKKLPEKEFRYFTTAVTCVSVFMLLI